MADGTENTNDGTNTELELGERSNENSEFTSDPILGKHLDMAIEAQDGKKQEADRTDAKGGEQETDPNKQQSKGGDKDSTSNNKDSAAQPKSGKEGKKDEKHSAGPKDLVDAQGNVIARGGAERRFYEQAQTARQEVAHVRAELTKATQRAEQAENALTQMQQTVQTVNGMKPEQMAVAARLFRDISTDPSGTLKKLLAEAVASGYTIEGIGAGIDVAAIKEAIRAELGNNTKQEPTEQEQIAEIEKEVTAFFSQYPDAKPHDALIARFVRDNPGTDLGTAYFQLKNEFANRGLDWSLPLEQQLEAATGKSEQSSQQQQSDASKPLPNGRQAAGNSAEVIKDTPIAHESTDMGDIVRQAMRENGMNIN